jgi:hypothetical protein
MSKLSSNPSIPASSCVLAIGTALHPIEAPAYAESLLRFSPRLTYRSSETRTWFFLDLACAAGYLTRVHASAEGLAQAVRQLFRQLGAESALLIGIADSPATAQALACAHGEWIMNRDGDVGEALGELPLTSLLDLEGLQAWESPARVSQVASFFAMLGFQRLSEVGGFQAESFQERWGATGEQIRRRLLGLDAVAISPYQSSERLERNIVLDFPVGMVSLLLHEIDGAIRQLLARLEGRRLVVRRLHLRLRCEYSNQVHQLVLEPATPSRERGFFMSLIENRLAKLDLDNPIKDLEIEVDPMPESEQQIDLLNAGENQRQELALKIDRLTALLQLEGLECGFARLEDRRAPEDAVSWSRTPRTAHAAAPTYGEWDEETGFVPHAQYARDLVSAPRPTLMLRQAEALSEVERRELQLLSTQPIERIEPAWWETRAGPHTSAASAPIGGGPFGISGAFGMSGLSAASRLSDTRDYYVAVDPRGRAQWLFQEKSTQQFYRHGYFD